ncbi:IclR family transcriptional regulator [Poriferisphaera corsica]|uniref:IclR family transcriptional regulator n=1 Tax=Poriferisphaera corsica TaxID=2528020 RepID=UPI001F27007D|nr:IclR family transcriptional regulator [Poriferisphaera corsica]
MTNKLQRVITGKDDQRLMNCAEPLLWELHAETDETVNLGVLSEDRVIYLKVIESAQPLRRVAEVNSTDPFYNTALGRGIVSQLPMEEREAIVQRANLVPRTDKTVADKQRLREILDAARRDGFAYEQDESDMGVTCLGVPVFENNRVVAAMSVSVPTVRMDDKRYAIIVDLLKSAATRLSDMLSMKTHG